MKIKQKKLKLDYHQQSMEYISDYMEQKQEKKWQI